MYGGPLVDPSENVKALNQAEAKRQDDLRAAASLLADVKIQHMQDMGALRAAHAETLRVSDLDRLDKTRQVDVLAGTASASALATAVQTLANTSDRNAETLRNLVNATAQTMAKQTSDQAAVLSAQTDSLVKDINARIADLQKSSYQGAGKSLVVDPQMERLAALVEKLAQGHATGTGKTEGTQWAIGVGIAVAGVLVALAVFVTKLIN